VNEGAILPMKTATEVKAKIAELRKSYSHVLTGTTATVFENAPRALMQLDAEAKLTVLHWVLGKEYKSKLKKSPHS
jgi:hypothetical protein